MIEIDKRSSCCGCIAQRFDFHDSLMARLYEVSEAREKVWSVCEENKANGRCNLIDLGEKVPTKIELMECIIRNSVRERFT